MPATTTRKPTTEQIAQQATDAYTLRQQGASYTAIAEALGVSEATARARVKTADATVAAATQQAKAKKAAKKAQPAKAEAKPATGAKWDAKTLKRVVALRDDGLSWSKITRELNLGSPGTARRAWREATGHTGPLPRLAGKGGRVSAEAE